MAEDRLSIYRASRSIKKKDNSLYNALRSIYEDSIFIGEISQLWPQLPLLANLRCGLWYSPKFDSACYFKSTDGHCNNWSFNTSRLNLHVAQLAGQKGGCIIVDSTRKGKRFPDSMSKTIPIWTCVLNRAIANYSRKMHCIDLGMDTSDCNASNSENKNANNVFLDWDCSLHLPVWVSKSEKASIEDRLEDWTTELEASGADIGSVVSSLKKPLRPLWISQKTVIWLNEVPDSDSWDFTPIILVSGSSSSGIVQQMTSSSEFSWHYIPGAGDDEESWARGLSPSLFWMHSYDIINSGPNLCNQKVADIVEKDRVYRAQRGKSAPQITIKSQNLLARDCEMSVKDADKKDLLSEDYLFGSENSNNLITRTTGVSCSLSWVGSTKLAVGTTQIAEDLCNEFGCILNCDLKLLSGYLLGADAYLHLPILTSKFDRSSLLSNLHSALKFAKLNLSKGKTVLVCCGTGEDISVCVCLAILTCLFNDQGSFDGGKYFEESCVSKLEMRKRLIFMCRFVTNARPSRGNLKQVFCFLNRKEIN